MAVVNSNLPVSMPVGEGPLARRREYSSLIRSLFDTSVPYGYMLKWGGWEFKQSAVLNTDVNGMVTVVMHAIGISKPKITKATAQASESTVEGNTSTNKQGPKPATFTFSIMYSVFLVNQSIHRLADFWYEKVGQAHPLLFGGGKPVTIFKNPMKLLQVDYSPEILGAGAWGYLKIDFKFEEVLPTTTTAQTTAPTSAVNIGA